MSRSSLGAAGGGATIEVMRGKSYGVDFVPAGNLTIQLDQDAELFAVGTEADTDRIGSGNTIALVGDDHVITVRADAQGTVHENGLITGFGTMDFLAFQFLTMTGAVWQAGAVGQPGTLVLQNGTATIGRVLLTGDYSQHSFITTQLGTGVVVVSLDSTVGMGNLTQNTGRYEWVGSGGSTLWGDGGNWSGPITGAPGSHDDVLLAGARVGGIGYAGTLTTEFQVGIDGTIDVRGTLNTARSANDGVTVYAGGTLSAVTARLGAHIAVTGSGAVLTAETLVLGAGWPRLPEFGAQVVVQGGGAIRADTLTTGFPGNTISIDGLSSVDIGRGSDAGPGRFVVESGTAISLAQSLSIDAPSVLIDGTIGATALSLAADATLSGTGLLEGLAGGTLTLTALGSSSPAIQLDGGGGPDAHRRFHRGRHAFAGRRRSHDHLRRRGAGDHHRLRHRRSGFAAVLRPGERPAIHRGHGWDAWHAVPAEPGRAGRQAHGRRRLQRRALPVRA